MTAAQSDYLRLTDRRTGGDVWTAYFAGDCVYDPSSGDGEPIGSDVADRVTAADLSVANLAAPLPADAEPIERAGSTEETAAETPAVLREAGFNVAALANDHVMDYGEPGLERTISACHERSLLTCGAGGGVEDAMAPVYLTVDGTSIAIFDFCERAFGVAREGEAGAAWISDPAARERVAEEADRSEVVVVLAHGGAEYVPLPSPRRQAQLREFADVGADLVVGHRPHVPQGWEVYEGTPIFYSLGDFLARRPGRPSTQWGLSLSVEFAGATPIAVELVPTVRANGAVRELGRGTDRSDRLHHLHRLSSVTADREALAAHWQEVAVRIFEERYADQLTAGTGGGLLATVRHPVRSLQGEERGPETVGGDELVLLDLLRNESRRDVVETALEVRTGDVEDRRTPEVRSAVREFLSRTEDRPLYEDSSSLRTAIGGLSSRLRPGAGEGADPGRQLSNDAQ